MGRLDEMTSYFDVLRQGNSSLSARVDECLKNFASVARHQKWKNLPKEELSEILSFIFQDCSFLLNTEQEGAILDELEANSLHGEIDLGVWKALFRYWSRESIKPVSAFIAVDVQNDFISGSLALRNCPAKQEGEEVVEVINNIKKTFKFNHFFYTLDWHPQDHCSFVTNVGKYPLDPSSKPAESAKIYDTVVYGGDYGREQILWPPHCIQGSHGAELHKDVKVDSADIKIYKGTKPIIDSYSAFWDNGKLSQTELLTQLLNRDVTQVFIGGLATDFCVAFTALDCARHGFDTFVVQEACRGVAEDSISEMTSKMIDAGVKIITLDQVKSYIETTK